MRFWLLKDTTFHDFDVATKTPIERVYPAGCEVVDRSRVSNPSCVRIVSIPGVDGFIADVDVADLATERPAIVNRRTANGMVGFDRPARVRFETLDLGARGIGVTLQRTGGPRRYMVVSETRNHHSAYEIARKLAAVDPE